MSIIMPELPIQAEWVDAVSGPGRWELRQTTITAF
jgi:hypothetical protein